MMWPVRRATDRFGHLPGLVLLVVVATACSGPSIGSVDRSKTSATTATTAPTSAAPTSIPAETVRSLLAAFGRGLITTGHMPAADPSWVARISPTADGDVDIDRDIPGMRNLVALVDEAAREQDAPSLLTLCFECRTDAALETRVSQTLGTSGALARLSLLLESTHALTQDGLTYPSFSLTPDQPDATMTADAKVLGVISMSAYVKTGMVTTFPRYAGANVDQTAHWAGVSTGTA
jgi:hypothetical protein